MSPDAAQIKERIISLIQNNGPSLPVQIANNTGLSILFASAFLSELFGDKTIKMSHLRVGSSPLYFLHGQEPQLEKFSQYLKSKEKEAFLILQEKKILKDSEQHPAIRVALREIKDFAFSFEKNGEIYWRYFLVEEPNDFANQNIFPSGGGVGMSEQNRKPEIKEEKIKIGEEIFEKENSTNNDFANENIPNGAGESLHEHQFQNASVGSSKEGITEQNRELKESKDKIPEVKEVSKKESHAKAPKTEKEDKPKKTAKTEKKDDNFFNKIKEYLSLRSIEIIDIKEFRNNEAVLKIKKEGKEELLFVFNKKRIAEKEILDAHKKASEEKMPYSILSLGETTKKLGDLIQAIKGLSSMDRIE